MLFFGEDFVTIFQITILTAIRSCTENEIYVCQKERQIFHGRVQNHIEQLIQCLRHAQISTRCFPSPPKEGPMPISQSFMIHRKMSVCDI